jgi:hypothetical protein
MPQLDKLIYFHEIYLTIFTFTMIFGYILIILLPRLYKAKKTQTFLTLLVDSYQSSIYYPFLKLESFLIALIETNCTTITTLSILSDLPDHQHLKFIRQSTEQMLVDILQNLLDLELSLYAAEDLPE